MNLPLPPFSARKNLSALLKVQTSKHLVPYLSATRRPAEQYKGKRRTKRSSLLGYKSYTMSADVGHTFLQKPMQFHSSTRHHATIAQLSTHASPVFLNAWSQTPCWEATLFTASQPITTAASYHNLKHSNVALLFFRSTAISLFYSNRLYCLWSFRYFQTRQTVLSSTEYSEFRQTPMRCHHPSSVYIKQAGGSENVSWFEIRRCKDDEFYAITPTAFARCTRGSVFMVLWVLKLSLHYVRWI